MTTEIDDFIREQKSKIASERIYLTKYSDTDKTLERVDNSQSKPFIFKMNEGENMKNKYKQELRNDFSVATGLDRHIEPFSGRKSKGSPRTKIESDDGGLLKGLRYTNSASRKERERNREYNDYKRYEEEKFKNRFSNKKPHENIESNAASHLSRNPITHNESIEPKQRALAPQSPPEPKERPQPQQSYYEPKQQTPRIYENKLDELERKVEELRNFRIQNPFIIYPTEIPINQTQQTHQNELQYSTTNLGKNHLRFLDDVEKKLSDIELKYSQTKSDIINRYKTPRKVNLPSILDDELIFEEDKAKSTSLRNLSNKTSRNSPEITSGIVPLGPDNMEDIKKHKQDVYRKELEEQMREKQKTKRNYSENNDGVNFFDKFSDTPIKSKQQQTRPVENSANEDDSDYFFYASHNPLDNYSLDLAVPTQNRPSFYQNQQLTSRKPEYFSTSTTDLSNRNDSTKKDLYADELKRQIEERKQRKEWEKKKHDEYDRKKNEEIANYNPFGKGGGGAPLKNNRGELIADLKQFLHNDPNERIETVRYQEPVMKPRDSPRFYKEEATDRTAAGGGVGFARGGHGIFGQALTQEDKDKAERYKEELQEQIVMKKRQKEIEKEQERIRDEKEQKRIEQQQKEMQQQLELERQEQMKKEQERLKQLEETRKAAQEEKKKTRLRTPPPQHQPEIRQSPLPREPENFKQTQQNDGRFDETKLDRDVEQKYNLPREDSKIMGQIVNLRNQLENEKIRIEQALLKQKDEVEIYDARLHDIRRVQKQSERIESPKQKQRDLNSEIFQAVLDKKGPLSVRRNQPKPKTNKTEEYSEQDLDAYLKEQERILNRMNRNDFSKLELNMPKMDPYDVGMRPSTQMSNQLEADTDFIGFYSSNDFHIPDSLTRHRNEDHYNFDDGSSNMTPRIRSRRDSNSSLNIEELTRKNKERLRKLRKLQDENESQRSSDEILNRIITSESDDTDFLTYRR